MRAVLWSWFSILMFFGVCTAPAQAQTTHQLINENIETSLTDNFEFYFETDTQLTISEAIKRRPDFRFYTDPNPNFGFQSRALWLVTKFNNTSNTRDWVFNIDFSQLDKVDFYLVRGDEVLKQSHQGKLQTEQIFRVPTMRAELPVDAPLELYLRVESSSSSLIVPLSVEPETRHSFGVQLDSLLWGLFYGGLIILAIYNFALFFGSREPSLVAYVGYIVAVLLWQFVWGGHLHLIFRDGFDPWFAAHTEMIFVIIGISSGLFAVTFLETKKHAPNAHPVIMSLLVLQGVIGAGCLIDLLPHIWKNNLVYGVGMIAICSYIYAGFEAYLNKFKPALYFIFAWGMLASGAIVGILSLLNILPSNDYTTYCFQVGVFIEAGLFSFALMEKSRNQLASEVSQATNELRNNMELIEEQNARLDIARKDAIKASNVKSQFLANMSHEIRTPLNAILGFSKELTHVALPVEQQEQVRIINTAADNLLGIVNDVLDFSKIEAGKLQINNQPFSPNQLLEDMVTLMSKSAHSKRLEFVFDTGPLPEKLIGDVFRIKQVLNNLLSNALKFTSSGTITLTVRGTPLPHGIHELHFRIEDTGIGISRQDKKKLFNAFSQIDDALNRSYQGTGLGLVICRELIKLMRGTLDLNSVPGLGSVFDIRLRANQLSQKYSLTPNAEWIGKRVVVFDPVPDTRRATASMLTALGARVTSADSVAFLNMLDIHPDLLFATVPVSHLEKRNTYLSELVEFPAKKRILWYSGPEPFNQYPSLTQHFHEQVRMPVTLTKLESLLHQKTARRRNPMQDKMNNLPKARILAVDDMEMNLKLLHTWLDHSPVSLTTSMSGQDAVNRCQSTEYDLILMDVQMPGMDGLQASRLIRKTALNMGTPIIAVTAHAFKEEQERLLASGMDDYLPKPIEMGALLDLIKRWCQNATPTAMALPTLDWQLAVKRTHQNPEAARSLLGDFVVLLPPTISTLKSMWKEKDFDGLKAEVHKLHGACCYTGVPKLQELASELEIALKLEQNFLIAEHLPALLNECEILMTEARRFLEEMNYTFP